MKTNRWTQEVLLHDHLDGSFPLLKILPELFRLSKKEYPFGKKGDPREEIKNRMAIGKNAEDDQSCLMENISTAVFQLQADRIGHAVALARDPALMKAVIDKKIGIEGCPGSNFALKYIPDMKYLRIREMLEAGVLYSLNPDDDLFLPNIQETFGMCDAEYNFTDGEKRLLRENSWKSKFGGRKYDGAIS